VNLETATIMVSAINFAMSASIFLPDSVSALSVMMFPPVRGELYKYGFPSDNAEKRQLEKNARTAGKNTSQFCTRKPHNLYYVKSWETTPT
jgi:hypothetical protein